MPRKGEIIDINGEVFGRLTVYQFSRMKNGSAYWACHCECGNIATVNGSRLRNGHTQSCGCLVMDKAGSNFIDETGATYGRWTVVGYSHTHDGSAFWDCVCDCGKKSKIEGTSLRSGNTKSCGCLAVDNGRKRSITHGGANTVEYRAWKGLRARCNNKNNARYGLYGGRGIKVCKRWNHFVNFIEDMGRRPSKNHSIDRIDNDGDYCPENCRWANQTVQVRNSRRGLMIKYRGETRNLSGWCEHLNLPQSRTAQRLRNGWSIEEAFETPALKSNRKYPINASRKSKKS